MFFNTFHIYPTLDLKHETSQKNSAFLHFISDASRKHAQSPQAALTAHMWHLFYGSSTVRLLFEVFNLAYLKVFGII